MIKISGGIVSAFVLGLIFSAPAFAADGAALYKAKCTPCHGAEGQGTAVGPGFKGNEFIKNSSDAEIGDVITKGREGAAKKYKQFALGMPKQSLKPDEVKAVVDHVRSLEKK